MTTTTKRFDRFFNPNDGTYANVPIIAVHPEKYRGKRPFGTNVLIGNWYEDRSKFKESSHRPKPFYRIEYPAHAGAVPDTVYRRKLLGSTEERPGRLLLDHHDIDSQKQFISSYDEQYNRRGPYGEHRDTSERKWALQDDYWLPERSDHPLESTPTSWGLVDRKRSQSQFLRRQRTIPDMSEYTDQYYPYRPEVYSSSKRLGIPRIYPLSIERSVSDCTTRSMITAPDPMEVDFACSPRRNPNIPRSHFYRGRVPEPIENRMREKLPLLTESTSTLRPLTSSMEQCSSQEQTVLGD